MRVLVQRLNDPFFKSSALNTIECEICPFSEACGNDGCGEGGWSGGGCGDAGCGDKVGGNNEHNRYFWFTDCGVVVVLLWGS